MRVIVIEAPGLNLGYIGCYGNEWVTTPTLDRLAVQGIVFDQHYADCPDSARAYDAWQTGRYRFPHPDEKEQSSHAQPACPLSILQQHGVATWLISGQADRISPAALAGWQHVRPVPRTSPSTGVNDVTRDALSEALDALGSASQWLLRVDFTSLMPPRDVPSEFRSFYQSVQAAEQEGDSPGLPGIAGPEEAVAGEEMLHLAVQDDYAAAVSYFDAGVGDILEEIDSRGLGDDLLLLLSAACGQETGARNMAVNGHTMLHDELVHVPLILRLPGQDQAGRRSGALTQTVDLLPTFFDAFEVTTPPLHGQSLLPLARGKANKIRAIACAGLQSGDRVEWALRSTEWYFLLPMLAPHPSPFASAFDQPRPELYVKPDDRWEINNVYQHHLELAEHLERVLRGFVEATRQPGSLQVPELGDLEAVSSHGVVANQPTPTTGGARS
jgi:arylsulfatase A-like enzyme